MLENYYDSDEHETDIDLLSAWILGSSYADIAVIPPVYERSNALFGGKDKSKRTSDATEYIGKLTYPASWVWSGARVLAGSLGESFPNFIRDSIESGPPLGSRNSVGRSYSCNEARGDCDNTRHRS